MIEENTLKSLYNETLTLQNFEYIKRNFEYSDSMPTHLALKNIRGWPEMI